MRLVFVLLVCLFCFPCVHGAERVVASPMVAVSVLPDELRVAIAEKRVVTFLYKGVVRVVHPHRVGISSKGRVLLRAWEVKRGEEATGQWKLYTVEAMEDVVLLEDIFEVHPEHRREGDKAMPGGVLFDVVTNIIFY